MRRPYLKHYSFWGGNQPAVAWVERLRSVFEAFSDLMLVLTMVKFLGGLDEWLMASLGASAILVFALPHSPMGLALDSYCWQHPVCIDWNGDYSSSI